MATIFEPPPPYSQQPSLQQQILDLRTSLLSLAASIEPPQSAEMGNFPSLPSVGSPFVWPDGIKGSLVDSGKVIDKGGGLFSLAAGRYLVTLSCNAVSFSASTGLAQVRLNRTSVFGKPTIVGNDIIGTWRPPTSSINTANGHGFTGIIEGDPTQDLRLILVTGTSLTSLQPAITLVEVS